MAYHVYVLLNPDGKTYIGHDLERRLAQHNEPDFRGTLHTKRHRGPWRLIHSEAYPTRGEAMGRERELKSGKGREWIQLQLLGGC